MIYIRWRRPGRDSPTFLILGNRAHRGCRFTSLVELQRRARLVLRHEPRRFLA